MAWVHPEQFRRCVVRYRGDYKVLSFSFLLGAVPGDVLRSDNLP